LNLAVATRGWRVTDARPWIALHRAGRIDHQGTRRKDRERVDVTVRIRGHPDAEMNRSRRAVAGSVFHGADGLSLAYLGVLPDLDRAEPDQRNGVSVGRLDSYSATVVGHRACEGNGAGGGSEDIRVGLCGDVDAAVLPAGIRIVAERERPDDLAIDRPHPAQRRSREDQRGDSRHDHEHERTSHPGLLSVVFSENGASIARREPVVNSGYRDPL
jgi:hypothetical protein